MAVNLWDSWVSVLNGKHLSLQSEFDSRSSFLDNITNAPAAYLDPTNHPHLLTIVRLTRYVVY